MLEREIKFALHPTEPTRQGELERALSIVSPETARAIRPYVERALLDPVQDVLSRPSKKLRAQLVDLGFDLLSETPVEANVKETCMAVLECLHAGSLIIDDIEDGSLSRRGKPTLHRKYGVATALNAGNWMYFDPLERVAKLNLSPEKELGIYRAYHRALLSAHLGQAIDIGVQIDKVSRAEVEALCLASIELKSGRLTALSLVIAGHAVGATEDTVAALDHFGASFGTALQMFDDLGNLSGALDAEKRWEDLKLRRPSWVWASIAKDLSEAEYDSFRTAVQSLPVIQPVDDWIRNHQEWYQSSLREVRSFVERSISELQEALPNRSPQAWRRLKEIKDTLLGAYV